MQSCLFFSVKMFLTVLRAVFWLKTISCSVFNEINKKRNTLNLVFGMVSRPSEFPRTPAPWGRGAHGRPRPGRLGAPARAPLGTCLPACDWDTRGSTRCVPGVGIRSALNGDAAARASSALCGTPSPCPRAGLASRSRPVRTQPSAPSTQSPVVPFPHHTHSRHHAGW